MSCEIGIGWRMLSGGGWGTLVWVGGILGEWYWLCIYITTDLVENIITHMQNGKGQKEGDGLAQNKKYLPPRARIKYYSPPCLHPASTMGHPRESF